MKVELSIADDRELRDHIKDVIKGQVLSIARGEIRDIIAQAVDEKAIPKDPDDIRQIIVQAIKDLVKQELGARRYGKSWIREEAREQIAEFIKSIAERGNLP